MSTCLDELNGSLIDIRDAILSSQGWAAFAPTLTQTGDLSPSIDVAVWRLLSGNRYQTQVRLIVGAAGTSGDVIRLGNLPFNPASLPSVSGIGYGSYWDVSETRMYVGVVFGSGTNEVSVWLSHPDGIIGTNPAFGAGANDVISINVDFWLF